MLKHAIVVLKRIDAIFRENSVAYLNLKLLRNNQ